MDWQVDLPALEIILLRIIAGQYRGRVLKSPPSMQIRPTSDRLRETLFNVLAPRIQDTRFLDLCAGSGAVGIEALSRGARHVTFVDRSQKIGSIIASNLRMCGISEDQAEVWTSDAMQFLKRDAQDSKWEIVFFDPPYQTDYGPVLSFFGTRALLKRR